jgi:phenylacetate-CoA ligase
LIYNILSKAFHKFIYTLGEKARNPLIRNAYSELLKSDFLEKEQLHKIQTSRLRNLLSHAVRYSEFYSKSLEGIDTDNICLKNMHTIPIITKEELQENISSIFNNPNNDILIKSETSGSTGDALIFYRSQQWDAYHRAAQKRGYDWHGIKPWDKNIYFWGFNPSFLDRIKVRVLDYLMNRYRFFSFGESEVKLASKILNRCSYIEGYSSAIYTLAQKLQKFGLYFPNVKLVKGTSEKIYDGYQKVIKDVFGRKMISEYGAAEAGIIAFECLYGNMHVAMENVIIEESNGKVLVTNLHSHVSPIIRYELGDYIKLNKVKECKCGRHHDIIEEITGRIGKEILGFFDTYPTLTLYYIFKNIALKYGIKLSYYGKQVKKGELILDVISAKEGRSVLAAYIQTESVKYFKNDVMVRVVFIEELAEKNRKTKDFESCIVEELTNDE